MQDQLRSNPHVVALLLAASVLCMTGSFTTASTDKVANDKAKEDKPKAEKPKPTKPAAKDAKEGKDSAKVIFPWRADKEGNVMLLQKLRYKHEGKPQERESMVRVIAAARVKEAAAKVKPAPTKLMKVRRKSAEWHLQKNGDVMLMQHRTGPGKDGKPATETALVARIPAAAAGAFAAHSLKPPVVVAGQRPTTFWSRAANGVFVLYQNGVRVPIAGASVTALRTTAYFDRDYDGKLEDTETYTTEESEYLDDLDDDDDADFDDDEDDFVDEDGDGLDDDDDDDEDDDDDDDDDDDEDDDDDDEDGDYDDDDGDDD